MPILCMLLGSNTREAKGSNVYNMFINGLMSLHSQLCLIWNICSKVLCILHVPRLSSKLKAMVKKIIRCSLSTCKLEDFINVINTL